MLRGTCAFFGLLGGKDALRDLVDHHIQIVRDGPAPDPAPANPDKLAEYVGLPLILWYIVGAQGFWEDGRELTPENMRVLTRDVLDRAVTAGLKVIWLECCNEPNRVGSTDYAALVNAMYEAAAPFRFQIGIEIVCCGVGRHDQKNLNWVEAVIAAGIPEDVILGPHDYPIGMNAANSETSFPSLDAQDAAWKAVAAGRRLAVGEDGFWNNKGDGQSAAQAMASLKTDLDGFEANGYVAAITYQLMDGPPNFVATEAEPEGPDGEPINRCGLKFTNGVWKPGAADIFPAITTQPEIPAVVPPTSPAPYVKDDMNTGYLRYRGTYNPATDRYQPCYTGVDPINAPDDVYTDRTEGSGWERVEVTDHGGGRYDFRYVDANRQLCLPPYGTLETRPATIPPQLGDWELPYGTEQPDGSLLVYRIETGGALTAAVLVFEWIR